MSESYALAIVGSRSFPRRLEEKAREFMRDVICGRVIPGELGRCALVVTGGAMGPDSWAEDEAKKAGVECRVIRPEWDKYGKRAAYLRNVEIVKAADNVIAFLYAGSKGTSMTIKIAQQEHIPVAVIEATKDGTLVWGHRGDGVTKGLGQ